MWYETSEVPVVGSTFVAYTDPPSTVPYGMAALPGRGASTRCMDRTGRTVWAPKAPCRECGIRARSAIPLSAGFAAESAMRRTKWTGPFGPFPQCGQGIDGKLTG